MRYICIGFLLTLLVSCASNPHASSVKIYIQQNNIEKAIEEGKKWVEDAPGDPTPYMWLGVAYVHTKEYTRAADNFLRAFEIDPSLRDTSKLKKTLSISGTVFLTPDGIASTFVNASAIYAKEGKQDNALRCSSEAIRLSPGNPQAYLLSFNIYQQKGERDKAIRVLEEGVKNIPQDKQLHYFLALMYKGIWQDTKEETYFSKTLYHLRKSVEIDPEYAKGYLELGVIYFYRDSLELAEDYLKKAVSRDSTLKDAWFSLGVVQLKDNKLEDAKASLIMYTNLSPKDSEGWLRLGVIYYSLKQYESALNSLDKAGELNPEDPNIWVYKGEVYKSMGRVEDSLNAFRMAQKLEKK